MLQKDKMPEAEVTLRLAMAIIEEGHTDSSVVAAIDGAQVKTGLVSVLRSLTVGNCPSFEIE